MCACVHVCACVRAPKEKIKIHNRLADCHTASTITIKPLSLKIYMVLNLPTKCILVNICHHHHSLSAQQLHSSPTASVIFHSTAPVSSISPSSPIGVDLCHYLLPSLARSAKYAPLTSVDNHRHSSETWPSISMPPGPSAGQKAAAYAPDQLSNKPPHYYIYC